MATIDYSFMGLCKTIFKEGREYTDENRGVKRLQIPSYTFKHSFEDGFPALSLKKLPFKQVVGELLWFLSGDTDIKYLKDNNISIWDKDAYNWYLQSPPDLLEEGTVKLSFEDFVKRGRGSVGRNYSAQWRDFGSWGDGCGYFQPGIDQIENLIIDMRENIMSTRLKVNAWNPAELTMTALPPCHSEFQVVGVPLELHERNKLFKLYHPGKSLSDFAPKGMEVQSVRHQLEVRLNNANIPRFGFELHWNQRSVDTFLGLPFNIASYATLAKILQSLTGYPALGIEGTLKCVHFYDNQYDAVREMLQRDPEEKLNCDFLIRTQKDLTKVGVEIFDEFKIEDFVLAGYSSHPPIKVEMLAPNINK